MIFFIMIVDVLKKIELIENKNIQKSNSFFILNLKSIHVEILTNVDSEAAEALNILVYPNPSADKINFSIEGLNQSKISQIRFISAEGKESLSLENPNQLNGIDISHLPSGVYFIELTLNETDSKSRSKFIKL